LDGIFDGGSNQVLANARNISRSTTVLILIVAVFVGCGTIVKLNLPPADKMSFENDWLTLGRNNLHTNSSPYNIAPPLETIWRVRVKSVVTDHPLAVGNNILALTQNGEFYQVDYESGKLLGSGNLGPAINHAPTLRGKILYTGFNLGEHTLIGFDLETAHKILKRTYPHINTTPLFWDEKLYFGTNTGVFVCINSESGDKIWSFEAQASIQSSPALKGQQIIFGDDKGWIYALDATSGLKLWTSELKENVFSYPVISDSLVLIGTIQGNLYALRLKNGKRAWKREFPGAIFGSPSIFNDTIYIGNNDHKVVALSAENGEILWEFNTGGIVNTAPLPSPDYVYVASWDEHLYVLNRFTGKLLFKMDLKKPLKSSPIIYKDLLLVQTANGHLYALANAKYAENIKGSQ
jgi:outer membrane protein assembly factor BamB